MSIVWNAVSLDHKHTSKLKKTYSCKFRGLRAYLKQINKTYVHSFAGYRVFLYLLAKKCFTLCLQKFLERYIQSFISLVECSLVGLHRNLFQCQFRTFLYKHIYRTRTSATTGHSGPCHSQLQHTWFIWTAVWFVSSKKFFLWRHPCIIFSLKASVCVCLIYWIYTFLWTGPGQLK